MSQFPKPLDLLQTGLEAWHLVAETQEVVAYRLMGMAGFWSVLPTENSRMVSEKGPAFAEAAASAIEAASKGQRPDQVMMAAMKPLRKKTTANAKRLSKRGMTIK
ncbi:antifreeze protein [Pseudogemmobacter sp. W21_MBD1_M6]|uniref:antifreeze protein n=1 Tax=Pseudogemmobacter sp. W21_MBD1_M6 TaxID=3240271 RepID=UPI003F956C98